MSATALAVMALVLFLAADRYDRPREGGIYLSVAWLLWGGCVLCMGLAAGVQIGDEIAEVIR